MYALNELIYLFYFSLSSGGKHKSWCKRWFILSDNCLYYFKSPNVSMDVSLVRLSVHLSVHMFISSICSLIQLIYPSFQDKEPRGIIPLENLEVKDCVESRRQVSIK